MDNILKLLLAVLGVAGLLAMLAPTGFGAPEPAPAAVALAPPPQPAEAAPTPNEPMIAAGAEYNFKIGEPTIDGKPIVDQSAPPQNEFNIETPSEPAQGGNGDATVPAMSAPAQGSAGEATPAM